MDALRPFVIPINGLKTGQHRFVYQVDREFFSAFEDTLVEDGDFQVELVLDKRPRLMVLDFQVSGTEHCACDRCLEPINLPVEGEYRLYVKYGEGSDDEPDVVFIPEGELELDVSQFVYEYIGLSLPIVKAYDCEDDPEPPCNQEVLDRLAGEEDIAEEDDETGEDLGPWSELKKWNDLNKE